MMIEVRVRDLVAAFDTSVFEHLHVSLLAIGRVWANRYEEDW